MMGLLDQLLGPVDLQKQDPMLGKPKPQQSVGVPSSAPSWVGGSLAPGGQAPPPSAVTAGMGMQENIQNAMMQQGIPSTPMQSSAPPGAAGQQIQQQMPQQVRVKIGNLW